MNQQQKDEQAAKVALRNDDFLTSVLSEQGMATANSVYPRAFLAGIQYARNEAREEGDKSFDEWLNKQCLTECLDRDDLEFIEDEEGEQFVSLDEVDRATRCAADSAWLACAQSMEAKHREEIERLKNDLLDAHQEIDILKAYAKVDREESISLGNENFKLKSELAERDKILGEVAATLNTLGELAFPKAALRELAFKINRLLNKQTKQDE